MPPSNLTSYANVKAWLNLTTDTDQALVTRLIAQASRFIYAYLQRPTLYQSSFIEVLDGSGSQSQMLSNWPVLAVSALKIGTQSIAQASDYGQVGYTVEPTSGYPPGRQQSLLVCGYQFCTGLGNVAVSYTAGYVVQAEAWTIPGANHQVTVLQPYGAWAVDEGVTFTGGAVLTSVTGTPSTGQYAVNSGVYTFAAADAGRAVQISYSYIPADIEQACIEIVAERYRYRDRIGQTSKSLGGQETMAYSLKDLQDYVRAMLQPYRRVTLF